MHSKSRIRPRAWGSAWVIGAAATLVLSGSMPGVAADPDPATRPLPTSNKWRIEFDGKADVDGVIVLAIINDGVTTNVTTQVAKGKSENSVASMVVKELKKQAPPKLFHFETDDGEDVLVKKKVGMGVKNFSLQLVSNSVTGVKVEIEKE